MYKKALHGFFLKVHPDFFHQHREQQRVNEASIAQLNELLNWAKEFKVGTIRPPPANRMEFTFYRKLESEEEQAKTNPALPKLQSTFELPKSFSPTDANKGVAERAVNKFLRDLLRRAECIDDTTAAMSQAQDKTEELATRRVKGQGRDRKRKQNLKNPSTLMEDAADSMAEQWVLPTIPSVDELVASDQVMLSRDLSPLESAQAIQTLTSYLPHLQYQRWSGMPLLITKREWAIGQVKGTITVPYDFNVDRFLAFLHANDAAITKCREAAEEYAQRIESLMGNICRELEIDDILISCPHVDALPCLQLLYTNIRALHEAGITKLTLELSTRFSYRRNGVIMIDCKADRTALRKALKAFQPHTEKLQKMYKLAKTMLESIEWHTEQIHQTIQPAIIDVSTISAGSSDNGEATTYSDRLRFVKELYRITPQLSQFDWSDISFVLVSSPNELKLDWENGMMCLPANFDGSAFVKYVNDIHQSAKENVRDKLMKESASAEAFADKREEEHRRMLSLLPDLQKQSESAANDMHLGSSGAVLSAAEQERAMMAGHPESEYGKAMQRSGYGDEYLTSSSMSLDELRTERPLHHDMATFSSSDDDANDQLKWEGFYKSPYADVAPAADEDDQYTAFRAMNRNSREEAVKHVIREMREASGKTDRFKNRDSTLGDLVGLNDYTKVPKSAFPSVAKGTSQPDERMRSMPRISQKPPHMWSGKK